MTEPGRKRELLPYDPSGCRATIERAEGMVFYWSDEMTVRFERPTDANEFPIQWVHIASVTVRNLNAWPEAAVEETLTDPASAAAQASAGRGSERGAQW